MSKNGIKTGGKVRSPPLSESAATFRAACDRLGVDHRNCSNRLGISKSVFYEYGNGERRASETVWLLIESIEAYRQLHALFCELQAEFETLKENRHV